MYIFIIWWLFLFGFSSHVARRDVVCRQTHTHTHARYLSGRPSVIVSHTVYGRLITPCLLWSSRAIYVPRENALRYFIFFPKKMWRFIVILGYTSKYIIQLNDLRLLWRVIYPVTLREVPQDFICTPVSIPTLRVVIRYRNKTLGLARIVNRPMRLKTEMFK